MNRQEHAVQKPSRYCCRTNEHTGIGSEQRSKNRRAENKNPCGSVENIVKRAAESMSSSKLEPDQTRHNAASECRQNPCAHRHRRLRLEHPQHVNEQMWTAQIQDEQER